MSAFKHASASSYNDVLVRGMLGLPPVAPSIAERFGPPTYTAEQVLLCVGMCADAVDADAVRDDLRAAVSAAGSHAKWAAPHGLSDEYARQVANGHREPAGRLLKALGWERVTTYRRLSDGVGRDPRPPVTEGDSSRDAQSLPTGTGEGGWLLVPVEPTEAMLNAARENDAELREQGFNGAEVEGVWATMLALSPSPDTVVVGREREIAERTLDAAASYLTEQYGAPYGLSHPVDRERILALSSLPVEGGE